MIVLRPGRIPRSHASRTPPRPRPTGSARPGLNAAAPPRTRRTAATGWCRAVLWVGLGLGWTGPTAAETVAIPSPAFDLVRRVNFGNSRFFRADDRFFSTYAAGEENSAQQTWFRVGRAVAKTAAGRDIRSATLVFRAGVQDHTACTVYVARTALNITGAADAQVYDGRHPYPATPGTSASFAPTGYLTEARPIAIAADGSGLVDVTDWVKQHPDDAWLLTASPAADGAPVTSAQNAHWNCRWHWTNGPAASGRFAVRLVLELGPPRTATAPTARTAGQEQERT